MVLRRTFCILSVLIFFILTACVAAVNQQPSVLSFESEHYILYYSKEDTSVIDVLSETLENNYSRITQILQVELPSKSEVYIYPDIETFHQAVGSPGSPDWLVGRYYNKAIRIVSPNNPGSIHSYDSIIKVAVHEVVHLAASEINKYAPEYLT